MKAGAVLPALVAVLFAGIHMVGPKLRFLAGTPRGIWLSIGGGVSVAYVFVHLLPELANIRRQSEASKPLFLWWGRRLDLRCKGPRRLGFGI